MPLGCVREGGEEGEVVGGGGFPNGPYGLCGRKATLNSNPVSDHRGQELCGSRGGRPGLPVPNSLYGLRGHKATSN